MKGINNNQLRECLHPSWDVWRQRNLGSCPAFSEAVCLTSSYQKEKSLSSKSVIIIVPKSSSMRQKSDKNLQKATSIFLELLLNLSRVPLRKVSLLSSPGDISGRLYFLVTRSCHDMTLLSWWKLMCIAVLPRLYRAWWLNLTKALLTETEKWKFSSHRKLSFRQLWCNTMMTI